MATATATQKNNKKGIKRQNNNSSGQNIRRASSSKKTNTKTNVKKKVVSAVFDTDITNKVIEGKNASVLITIDPNGSGKGRKVFRARNVRVIDSD